MIIPVIIGATGITTKGVNKVLKTLSGTHSTDSLQQTAILGTSHIIRKPMQSET
jgi:5,10-methylenetetrahydrofolate reductase